MSRFCNVTFDTLSVCTVKIRLFLLPHGYPRNVMSEMVTLLDRIQVDRAAEGSAGSSDRRVIGFPTVPPFPGARVW